MRTSSDVQECKAMTPPEDGWLEKGYYAGPQDAKIATTPSSWFHSLPCNCWINPSRADELLPLFGLDPLPEPLFMRESAPDTSPQPDLPVVGGGAAPEPGSELEQRMVAVLDALNGHGEGWKQTLAPEAQVDTWGTQFEVERLTELDAGLKGYEYVVHSAGEDTQFGTGDDVSLHEEVAPDFHPSPLGGLVPEPEVEVEGR